MRKIVVVLAVAVCMLAFVSASAEEQVTKVSDVPYESVVEVMRSLTPDQLAQMDAIEIRPHSIPAAGVEVMRVRLEETYEVAGVGEDTVELTGWIAVRHGEAESTNGTALPQWPDFVIDTQFVALELEGHSDIFGPVRVVLDESRPAYGKVGGNVPMPEKARLHFAQTTSSGVDCSAPVNVQVSMPELGLEMKTQDAAVWHSRVNTVPPVGQQASVTVEPVALVDGDRPVATLLSGTIKFREVVRTSSASAPAVTVASVD